MQGSIGGKKKTISSLAKGGTPKVTTNTNYASNTARYGVTSKKGGSQDTQISKGGYDVGTGKGASQANAYGPKLSSPPLGSGGGGGSSSSSGGGGGGRSASFSGGWQGQPRTLADVPAATPYHDVVEASKPWTQQSAGMVATTNAPLAAVAPMPTASTPPLQALTPSMMNDAASRLARPIRAGGMSESGTWRPPRDVSAEGQTATSQGRSYVPGRGFR